MATDQSNMAMNGNYVPHQQAYTNEPNFAAAHSTNNSISADFGAAANAGNAATAAGNNADIPKDEVGWFFVEQYYTTLSRNPEKLYLFYSRKSQFVSGNETEKVSVSVGQKAINDRIQELDIKDCKVRVTNVDSQGSGSNIVIQVIGELSVKSQPQRKFTQTFVLAEQANGYYVLNDIFRYIMEEDDEDLEGEQAQPAAAAQVDPSASAIVSEDLAPHTLSQSQDPNVAGRGAALVDEGLQKAIEKEPALAQANPSNASDVNGVKSAMFTHAEDAPVAASVEVDDAASATMETIRDEDIKEPEKPKDPEPTPAPPTPEPTQKSQPAPTAAPIKPVVPITWANMVASNSQPTHHTAPSATSSGSASTAAATVPTGPAANKPTPAQTQISTPPAAPGSANPSQDTDQVETPQSSGSEWQTAGQDNNRKQARPQPQQPAASENSRAYIKSIGENIDPSVLRAVLSKAGEVTYLDINRQKNCAFVDFASPAAYQAAVKANPHEVAGEQIYVEERRVRPQSFAGNFNNRGGAGIGGRGRGGKDGGRGNYSGRSRGGAGVGGARGRGGPQNA